MSRVFSTLATLGLLTSCGGADPVSEPGLGAAPAAEVPEPHLRRLTTSQYEASVTQLLGAGRVMPTSLEPDTPVDGLLSIGAGTTSMSAWGVEQYETAAYLLAEQAVDDGAWTADNIPCALSGMDRACAEAAFTALGRQAWRRPLTADELTRVVDVVDAVASESDFATGVVYGLGVLLQSPHFLYRIEVGEPDPDNVGQHRLTDWELATRLSFLLWNAPPDHELLDAVEAGELSTPEGLRTHAERMIEDARYEHGVRALFSDVLELYKLDDLDKDPTAFTHASPDLGPSAREETLLNLVDLVVGEDGDLRTFMTRQKTFVDTRLAALYEIEAPASDGFGPVLLPNDGRRRGFLGQAAFLALHAHTNHSSATLRGVSIRQTLLCQTIPPPPAGLNTSIPEPDSTSPTLRDRLLAHQEDPNCATCHVLTDGVGLGLENFDGIGRWREVENGTTIDASGELDGVAFANAWQLGERIEAHPDHAACWVDHLYAYSTAHEFGLGEADHQLWLYDVFAANNYSFKELTLTWISSPVFRQVGEQEG